MKATSLKELLVIGILAMTLSGCDSTEQANIVVQECKASPETQKAFGDLAAMQGFEKMRAMLHEEPTLIHARINGSNDERPLHWASLNGSVEVVKLLLENGAPVDVKDAGGMTPLHWAAWQGKLDAVKSLVSEGAEVNAVNNVNQTPLDRAVNDNHDSVASYLESLGGKREAALK